MNTLLGEPAMITRDAKKFYEDDTTVDRALFFLILSLWRSGINDLTGGCRIRSMTATYSYDIFVRHVSLRLRLRNQVT